MQQPFDKAIYSLRSLTKLQEENENYGNLNENNYLVIPYESLVLDTERWLNTICKFLKIDNFNELKRYLPKIGCPM